MNARSKSMSNDFINFPNQCGFCKHYNGIQSSQKFHQDAIVDCAIGISKPLQEKCGLYQPVGGRNCYQCWHARETVSFDLPVCELGHSVFGNEPCDDEIKNDDYFHDGSSHTLNYYSSNIPDEWSVGGYLIYIIIKWVVIIFLALFFFVWLFVI